MDYQQQLIEENLKLTKEIHKMTKKIRHYVIMRQILSIVYFLIIVVPLILSIIYIPRFLDTLKNEPQKFLGLPWAEKYLEDFTNAAADNINLDNVDLSDLSPEQKAKLQEDAGKYLK